MSLIGALRLKVAGRVQGVGFRPVVYRMARSMGLYGSVHNTSRGVIIDLEGPTGVIERFESELPRQMPSLARIDKLEREVIQPTGHQRFRILPSQQSLQTDTGALVPYDVATCQACLEELQNPSDRRYRYPFTNCTLCGPRYTIIESVPYDRQRTSMKKFSMCAACQSEYTDPSNRRYHAQPNACPACGPALSLIQGDGKPIPGDPIDQARRRLLKGEVVALRGLGGFHLAVNASCDQAVYKLRKRKHRGNKPFAIMSPDLLTVEGVAKLTESAGRLLNSDQSPIVLLEKTNNSALSNQVAPGNPWVGVMLPYTPLHHLLLEGLTALVMTSGNLSDEPIVKDNPEAMQRLSKIADVFLLHDRDILMACDDSVVFPRGDRSAFVRRSRGWVPDPIALDFAPDGILAVGGQEKNTFCLTRDGQAFVSQHIGDLENLLAYDHFVRSLEHLKELLGVKPSVVACDLHPDYQSTRFALEQSGMQIMRVQHHHAHLAACMADNQLQSEVIGLTLDGTGLGSDGTIWGGEVLVGDFRCFRRAARLRPFQIPGGDAAVREPWRLALGVLLQAVGARQAIGWLGQNTQVPAHRIRAVAQAIAAGVNAPWTSSLGRLFDAVSALLGICFRTDYDAQAAIELEAAAYHASGEKIGRWPLRLRQEGNLIELDYRYMLRAMTADRKRGVPVEQCSATFHNTLVDNLARVCRMVREQGGPDRVVFSGGCFMNQWLDLELERSLTESGFRVYAHRNVPPNDGGLCLGQAAIAATRLQS